MDTSERRFVPGQVYTLRLKQGTTVVAVDGGLRLALRDDSLSWLCLPTPWIPVTLDEGQCHVMRTDGSVQIQTDGATVVSGLVMQSERRTFAWIRRIRTARWLMPIRG